MEACKETNDCDMRGSAIWNEDKLASRGKCNIECTCMVDRRLIRLRPLNSFFENPVISSITRVYLSQKLVVGRDQRNQKKAH